MKLQRFNRPDRIHSVNFLREKMICQLTSLAILFSAIAGAALAQPRGSAGRYSVDWQNLPLANAVDRIQAVSQTPIFVDRRVDPNRRVDLTAANANVADILANLASSALLGIARIGPLYYLGPIETADRLEAIATQRRREAAALDDELRRSISRRNRVAWHKLTEPRGLVTQLLREHGWSVDRGELIPHDLWAEGELPAMSLADQLTVLLAGFDLTYEISPERKAIEILPARWDSISPRSRPRQQSPQTSPNTPASKQVFTLRVENQPVGKVLDQLADRLGWKLDIDQAAIQAAGLSLDRLVSFEVENADEDQLLEAVLKPAGLSAARSDQRIRVAPRQNR
jgi:type II secretory pathway component GspD/PulD (secretin)